MQAFKNTQFTKRNYDCTNIVACVADQAPNENYAPSDEAVLNGLMHLYTQSGVRYYGYL